MVLKKIFWPPVTDGDELTATRKRLLVLISLLTGVLGTFSGTITGLETYEMAPGVTIVGILVPFSFLSLPFIAYLTKRQKLTALAMLTLLYADMMILAFGANGVKSTALIYMAAMPILATVMAGNRWGVAMCFIAVISYMGFLSDVLGFSMSFKLSILTVGLTAVIGVFQREMDKVTLRLDEARSLAEDGKRVKTDFLANMSHEIRTPLNGVIGMAQLLGRTSLDERQQKYADTILTSGTTLLSLINDILDLSRIEASEMTVHADVFNVRELMSEVVDVLQGVAVQKDLDLSIVLDPEVDGRFIGDRKKIQQILINFAGNAIKFTEEGGVEISAVLCSNNNVRFLVTDTGPGIEEDQLHLVFERFKQADNKATRKHGGTGLGLAISQKLSILMNGAVGADSAPGEGSTFWLEVPLTKCALPEEAETDGPEDIFDAPDPVEADKVA